MKNLGQILAVSISLSIVSCSSPFEKMNPLRMANQKIEQSFSIIDSNKNNQNNISSVEKSNSQNAAPAQDTQLSLNNNKLIQLQKSALGKAFLLIPTQITSSTAPIVDHLKPIIVSFEKSGDQLALFELNYLSVYDTLPSDKLIQTFEITNEDDDSVSFKWNFGLEFIPTKAGLTAISDFPEGAVIPPADIVIPTTNTFIRSLEISNNQLEIEQVSRIRGQVPVGTSTGTVITSQDTSVELFFKIRPYTLNPRFSVRLSEFDKGIGYFETLQLKKITAYPLVMTTRWDTLEKPIIYGITKNTPPEYVEAVKEGVLYWNKVFGKEVMKVEMDVDPKAKPQEGRVVIDWIPSDNAGFARASIQADPLTGEILQGSIYMSSAFAYVGKFRARKEFLLKDIHDSLNLKPIGLQSASVCIYNDEKSPLTDFTNTNQAAILKISQDYVRSTVAHEVGHTLGLRHNFAGSLSNEFKTPRDLENTLKKYLHNEDHGHPVLSSTVMDYIGGLEGSLLGENILGQALEYDQKAIFWGYSPTLPTAESLAPPLFCSDRENYGTNTLGCKNFDSGKNPIAGYAFSFKKGLVNLPLTIYNDLLMQLFPREKDFQNSFTDTLKNFSNNNQEKYINNLVTSLKAAHAFLLNDVKVLSVDRSLGGGPNWSNEAEYNQKTQDFISKMILEVDGLPGLFKNALPMDETSSSIKSGWLKENFASFLADKYLLSGTTLEGSPYNLTPDQFAKISETLLKLATVLESYYINQIFGTLTVSSTAQQPLPGGIGSSPNSYLASLGQKSWEANLGQIAITTLNETVGKINGKVGTNDIELDKPRFDLNTRLKSLNLLVPSVFKTYEWNKASRKQLQKTTIAKLQKITQDTSTNSFGFEQALRNISMSSEIKTYTKGELQILKLLEQIED